MGGAFRSVIGAARQYVNVARAASRASPLENDASVTLTSSHTFNKKCTCCRSPSRCSRTRVSGSRSTGRRGQAIARLYTKFTPFCRFSWFTHLRYRSSRVPCSWRIIFRTLRTSRSCWCRRSASVARRRASCWGGGGSLDWQTCWWSRTACRETLSRWRYSASLTRSRGRTSIRYGGFCYGFLVVYVGKTVWDEWWWLSVLYLILSWIFESKCWKKVFNRVLLSINIRRNFLATLCLKSRKWNDRHLFLFNDHHRNFHERIISFVRKLLIKIII